MVGLLGACRSLGPVGVAVGTSLDRPYLVLLLRVVGPNASFWLKLRVQIQIV
jgi:hypothetical protein